MIASPPAGPCQVRLLHHVEDLHACEAVAKLVWQVDDREVVPASHLRALAHAGGMVAGAFAGGRLVGFAVGFLARHEPDPELGLHSHLLAVLPEHRRLGVGRALKWFQRRWCLERGLPWITWTFDPLQARNARLNLEHLGAVGVAFLPDHYGTLGGIGLGGLATDRILARWTLEAPNVLRLAGGAAPAAGDGGGEAARVLAEGADGDPVTDEGALLSGAPRLRAVVPEAFTTLLVERPEQAVAWRAASRSVLAVAFERGYRATRFHDGGYLLTNE